MPVEVLEPTVLATPELHEAQYTADEFCQAFSDVYNLQRHIVATAIRVPPHKLAPSYINGHLSPEHGDVLLNKIDRLVNSDLNRDFIEKCIQGGDYSPMLKDEHLRAYISGLARDGLVAGVIYSLMNRGPVNPSKKRIYKTQLVEMSHAFVQLADGELGREIGFKRQHLRSVLHSAYGGHDVESIHLANSMEAGLAAEIATKRYLEKLGDENKLSVRYGDVSDDLKGADIICIRGNNELRVDVKSSDKNGHEDLETRAAHTKLEEVDIGNYRVRQLYPASHRAIDDNFEITAGGYKSQIEDVITEFNHLTHFTP